MKLEEATILVVDDEPELLDIFATWLRRSGCTVFTAVNGAEALKLLEEQKVDALISDIRMPIMDGVALVRRLFELGIHIPSIIFVSGFSDINARDVYALGVEALLAKPLSRQQFLHTVESCLKTSEEKWIDPVVEEGFQRLDLTFDSLLKARESCDFNLGRGGCCFRTSSPLPEDKHIQLSIHFSGDNLHLQAQGIVRWFHPRQDHAGVEFTYLDPACRGWVLATIQNAPPPSFIPNCAPPLN